MTTHEKIPALGGETPPAERAANAGGRGASTLPAADHAGNATQERDGALTALQAARQFIANGIEFGYIRMPDADVPDPAHDTPKLIDDAIALLTSPRAGLPRHVLASLECTAVWLEKGNDPQDAARELRACLAKIDAAPAAPVAEPTPDPLRRRVERLLVELHAEGRLSEGQCAKMLDIPRIDWRELAEFLAPAAQAVAADGEATDQWVAKAQSEFVSALILAICELPDRSSPEGEPGAMVANSDEIAHCVDVALEKTGLSISRRAAVSPATAEPCAHDYVRSDYVCTECGQQATCNDLAVLRSKPGLIVAIADDQAEELEKWAKEWEENQYQRTFDARAIASYVRKLARASQAAAPASPTAEVPIELADVKETLAKGDGFWRSCSGCHETEDGHPVGKYPYSKILECALGAGCSECGGIGAVWDNTDYRAMGNAFERAGLLNSPDAQAALPAEARGLSLMRKAFRVTEVGGDPDPTKQTFTMRFSFRSIEALHAADDEWRKFIAAPAEAREPFQARVQPWMLECFGPTIAADTIERNHRFLEEALELVQSLGCTASEAHQLVDYTFGRPIGEPAQEVGGVMVTLAALCLASALDMHAAGETELARISEPATVLKIRAKQAAKPKHSPLPQAVPARSSYEWRDTGPLETNEGGAA